MLRSGGANLGRNLIARPSGGGQGGACLGAMISGFGGGVSPFDPGKLPGLVVWLRPDKGVTESGGLVTGTVLDQSGSGNNFSPSSMHWTAAGINGLPSFRSIAADASFLQAQSAANVIIATSSAERIYAGQNATDPPSGSSQGYVENYWGTFNQGSYIPYVDGNIYDGFAATTRPSSPVAHPGENLASAYVVDSISAGATWDLLINGVSLVSTSATFAVSAVAPVIMGATIDALFGDYFVFDAPLSSANRSLLMAWLVARWGTPP
jgi:hypothetical protein